MKPHDWQNCLMCQFTRGVLVVGICAMAVVCFVASMDTIWHGRLALGAREFLGVPLCLGMAWFGLKALKGINDFFDWLFNKIEAKLQ